MDFEKLCILFEEVTLGTGRSFMSENPQKIAKTINDYISNNISSEDEKIHISFGNIYLTYDPNLNTYTYTLRQGYKIDLNNFLKSGHALVSQIPPFNFKEGTIYNFPKSFSPKNLNNFIRMVQDFQKRTSGLIDTMVYQIIVVGDDSGSGSRTEWPDRIKRTKRNLADMKSGFSQFYKDTLKPFSTSVKNYFQRK